MHGRDMYRERAGYNASSPEETSSEGVITRGHCAAPVSGKHLFVTNAPFLGPTIAFGASMQLHASQLFALSVAYTQIEFPFGAAELLRYLTVAWTFFIDLELKIDLFF